MNTQTNTKALPPRGEVEGGFSPCDYVLRVTDNQPKPLTKDMFLSLIGGMDTQFAVQEIRRRTPKAEAIKRSLPAVTWQSRFGGKQRSDKNAEATGFFCLDIDIHHEQKFLDLYHDEGAQAAYEWAEREAQERAERWRVLAEAEQSGGAHDLGGELDIVGICISPSGTGLHVIALCNPACFTIAEDQARLASLLKTEYDQVCKDPARIFFLSPKEDWKYLDLETLFQEEQTNKQTSNETD